MRKKTERYVSVKEDDGSDYKEISEVMTTLGFKMNHSSARNHVTRVVKKFAEAYIDNLDVIMTDEQCQALAASALFQDALCGLLQDIEYDRRTASN